MGENVFNNDVTVRGRFTCNTISLPIDCVGDNNVPSAANLSQNKLQHRHVLILNQNGSAADELKPVYVANVAGSVQSVKAASIAPAIGDSTVSIDVLKGGTTVLTAPIVLDNANSARVAESGTISGTQTLAIGDLLEIDVNATVGTGTLPTGLLVEVVVLEDGS